MVTIKSFKELSRLIIFLGGFGMRTRFPLTLYRDANDKLALKDKSGIKWEQKYAVSRQREDEADC